MTNSPVPPYQPGNVQGLILRGYTHPHSCHMLFTFKDRPGAAEFIGALLPHVQSAAEWSDKPDRMLNIGLTFNGILTFEPAFRINFRPRSRPGPGPRTRNIRSRIAARAIRSIGGTARTSRPSTASSMSTE